MAWLLYGSLVVLVVAVLRGLHVLGVRTHERDDKEWVCWQLEDCIKDLTKTNKMLLAQNERLIFPDEETTDLPTDPETFSGNVFPTE